ncbi:ABC transporter permease [Vandammella animalimorsus]|uniref:Sugar ABC transporter permease n=1 Tax=Vandammella animalimorsus TaxID=2029117 RepID=A0A2A2AG11_9BURK|nr:ABC transporter permease [Vandammella animalimorsus]PAT36684.1 sugar ABC transporter permease [Vandammella animalimorsus]
MPTAATAGRQAALRAGLVIQARVVGALLLREVITRYGRHGIGMLWVFFEPMLFTLGITALWYAVKLHTLVDVPVVAFAVTGYSSVLIWRTATNRCAKAIEPNRGLLYHRHVKVIDLFITRVLLELAGGTASFMLLTLIFSSLGMMSLPEDLLTVLLGWLLLGWLAFALGFIVGGLCERSDTFERIWQVINYLLFPISGAVYMVDWLAKPLQELVLWIPMVHGVEMVRHGFWGEAVTTHEDPAFFIVSNLALSLIGLALVRGSERRVELE